MNRNEFVIATAIVLMLAFTLGWFAHLVVQRLRRVSAADMGELEKLAQALHEAEETRDQAIGVLHFLDAFGAGLVGQMAIAPVFLQAVMQPILADGGKF